MGWHLTCECCENGELSAFPYSILWDAFKDYAHPARYYANGWNLHFPDGSSGLLNISIDDGTRKKPSASGEEMTSGFAIQRPGGLALFKALYRVISQAPTIVIWDDGRCFVADPAVISAVPEWLFKVLPPPAIVHSGEDIDEFWSVRRKISFAPWASETTIPAARHKPPPPAP